MRGRIDYNLESCERATVLGRGVLDKLRLTAVKGAEDHMAKIWIVHKGTGGQIP